LTENLICFNIPKSEYP